MYNIVKMLPLILLFTACDKATLDSSVDPKDLVKPKLEVTSKNITSYDAIEVVYKLKNYSTEKITYGFSSGCQFAYIIKRGNKTIYDLTKNIGCTLALTHFDIKPLESKEFKFSIHWSRFENPLESGTYTLETFLFDNNGKRATTQFVVG